MVRVASSRHGRVAKLRRCAWVRAYTWWAEGSRGWERWDGSCTDWRRAAVRSCTDWRRTAVRSCTDWRRAAVRGGGHWEGRVWCEWTRVHVGHKGCWCSSHVAGSRATKAAGGWCVHAMSWESWWVSDYYWQASLRKWRRGGGFSRWGFLEGQKKGKGTPWAGGVRNAFCPK